MKKLLVGSIAAFALTMPLAAQAADLSTPVYKAAPPPVVVSSWTGCYVDAGVGYGMWNQDHYNINPGFAPTTTVTTTDGGRGWLGRFGGGCDYQFNGSFVIGAFADYDFMGINGTNQPQLIFAGTPEMSNVKETGAWYAGGRIGYLPYPNLMTFVSGGWTQTRFTQSPEFLTLGGAATGFGLPSSNNVSGWFVGGGYEYRIPWGFNGLYWKTEYRFANYQSINLIETALATGAPSGNTQHSQSYVQTATTSLVWRFNWGGPVVARY